MKNIQPSIRFYFQKQCTLRDRQRLKEWVPQVFKRYKTRLESLNIIFCSDDYLLGINRQHLKHDYYTDIITFDLGAPQGSIAGEIYISVDRVRDNAKTIGTSFSHELHRVIFHGLLHLCGLNDKTPSDKKAMTKAEDKLLREYFVPRETR